MELRNIPHVREIIQSIRERVPESYVVGGAVRDQLMGKPLRMDLDLAVPCNGFDLARDLAQTSGLKATFVPLDATFGTGRIVLHETPPALLDISSFKDANIEDDLRLRDFTINAMAVSVRDFLEGAYDRVIDPTGGIKDLRDKTIRACSNTAFTEDPLRILRAFRFRACLGFVISPGTLDLIPGSLKAMDLISPERIRDEFIATLTPRSTGQVLREMDSMGIMDFLFPEIGPMKGCLQNEYHHLDVWGHTLEAVQLLEHVSGNPEDYFHEMGQAVAQYCAEEPVKGRQRSALLKLAMIFHDSGKPHTRSVNSRGTIHFFGHEKVSRELFEQAAVRLKLAGREIKLVGELIAGHMRTLIFTRELATNRAVYRLCRKFKKDVIGLFVLFLADLGASRGPARPDSLEIKTLDRVREGLKKCLESEKEQQKPLLNGREVMAYFGLDPGPYLGNILKKLDELQGAGEIRTRDEAFSAVKDLLSGQN